MTDSARGRDPSAARWLAAIVLLAAVLRLYPVWFGLPYPEARPDEETAISHAVRILQGDLNPHFFHWPSVTFYVFASVLGLASAIGHLWPGATPLSYADMVIIARTVVALAGTATVIVLARAARRVDVAVTGTLAALFLAVAVLHVRDSHFAMTDVLMTLLVVAALALLLRALDAGEAGGTPWFAAAGLAGGLAVSTKYSAAAIIAAMAAAQVVCLIDARRHQQPWRARLLTPGVVFGVACAAGFLAGTPYALLDPAAFTADVAFDLAHLSGPHLGVDVGRGWTSHLMRLLPYGAGLSIFVAAAWGVVPMVRHHGRAALVLGAFGLALYASLGGGATVFFRYILPLVPLLCLFAAVGVRHASTWIASRTRWSYGATLALLATITAAPAFASSLWMDTVLARTDTRVLAARWLADRLQPADTLHDAGNDYTKLRLDRAPAPTVADDGAPRVFSGAAGPLPDWLVLYESPLRVYTETPAALRDLAASRYRLMHTETGVKDPAGLAVYDLQDAFFLPLSGFHTIERPGPTVRIYRRADLPDR